MTAKTGLLAAVLVGIAGATASQTTVVPGGVELTLGVSQRLEFDDNLPLSSSTPGNSYQSKTTLNFGLKSETPTDRIGITASTLVRGAWGKGNANRGVEIDDPRFVLSYGHDSTNSSYTLNANYRRSDLQFLRPLTDFLDANGNVVLPTDIDDLFGTGFRTDYGVNGSLSFGTAAPFGGSVSLGVSGLTYDKVTNAALVDSQNRTLGTNFRFRLNDVTTASAGFGFTQFENLSANTKSNSRTLDLGLSRALVNGTAGLALSSRNSANGTRFSLSVNRAMALPNGSLSFGLGTTRLSGSAPSMTGSLNWSYQLPSSSLSAQVSRQIGYTNTNAEQLQTVVSVAYNQVLTARSGLNVNVAYSVTDLPGQTNSSTNTSIAASYGLAVTPDWSLNMGYTRTMRDSQVSGKADSNLVFVGLQRTFNLRP